MEMIKVVISHLHFFHSLQIKIAVTLLTWLHFEVLVYKIKLNLCSMSFITIVEKFGKITNLYGIKPYLIVYFSISEIKTRM